MVASCVECCTEGSRPLAEPDSHTVHRRKLTREIARIYFHGIFSEKWRRQRATGVGWETRFEGNNEVRRFPTIRSSNGLPYHDTMMSKG